MKKNKKIHPFFFDKEKDNKVDLKKLEIIHYPPFDNEKKFYARKLEKWEEN